MLARVVLYLFDLPAPGARSLACDGANGPGHVRLVAESRIRRDRGQLLTPTQRPPPCKRAPELTSVSGRTDAKDLSETP